MNRPAKISAKITAPMQFIFMLGLVSLFADVTYEGARSITGPYLDTLGASGLLVGMVAGAGELAGYGLRLISGAIADRTRRYWTITIAGYAVNLLAVPALAWVGRLDLAVVFIIAERVGKAIRTPARDAMLSYATSSVGHGKGFGIHEALDQIGAVVGPLVVAMVLHGRDEYTFAFGLLLLPAILALITLMGAWQYFPNPEELEIPQPSRGGGKFPTAFWIYLAGLACLAAGYADFALVSFHFQQTLLLKPEWIPAVYAGAMAVEGIAALLLGRWFDRFGIPLLILATAISAFAAPLIFRHEIKPILLGMAMWGIGMGAMGSIGRAVIASMIDKERRATAFGIMNGVFGFSWFIGSALMGYFYDTSLPSLILFSVAAQLAAIPLFVITIFSRGWEAAQPGLKS